MDMSCLSGTQVVLLLLVPSFLQAVTISPLPFLGFNDRPGSRPGKATFLGNEEASRVRRGSSEDISYSNQIGTGYTVQKSQPGFYGKPSQYDYRPWNNGGNSHREYYPKYKPEVSYWDDNRRGHECEPGRQGSFAGHGYFNTPSLQGGGGGGWSQGTGDGSSPGTTEGSGYPSGGSSWDSGRPSGFPPNNGDSWNGGSNGGGSWRRPGNDNWNRPTGGRGGSSWDSPGGGPGDGSWNGPGGRPGGSNWNGPGAEPGGNNWNRPGGGGGNWNGPGGGNWNRPSGGSEGSWSRPGGGGSNWNGPGGGGWNRPEGGNWNGPGGGGGPWNGPSGSNWGRPNGGGWNGGPNWSGNGGESWDGSTGNSKWNSPPIGSSGSRGESIPEGTVGFYGRTRGLKPFE